jgi:magnesium chelatase accessory protein
MFSLERPLFAREGADWPLRQYSRFVEAGGLRWHVQRFGRGPGLLLLHGTGGATHSWRGLAPLLAERFEVLAPDLPGHGFTGDGRVDYSLPGMARHVAALLQAEQFAPEVVVGHSAGAAVLARLCLDGAIAPSLFVGINAAMTPFGGVAGFLFPPLAKLMSANPLLPRLFAWSADREAVARLIAGMGSRLDARGIDLYTRLFGKSGHCDGALQMMANWRLDTLIEEMRAFHPKALLIVGAEDKAVPPADAARIAAAVPNAEVAALPGLGHLAHEEKPEAVARLIFAAAEAAPAG